MVYKWLIGFLFVLVSFGAAQQLRVGLGYLPDVQFAPFYLAQEAGLYAAEGLEVTFQHGFVTELYPLLAQGRLNFVVGDAEDVITLRAQDERGAPFRYIMAIYQRVPNAFFSLGGQGITDITTLAGKRVGIPGLFGTSYTTLQASLLAAGLSEDDIELEQIGFTQAEAVMAGRVDVALGFINNEPIVLRNQGLEIDVIDAGVYNPSVGNGVITTDAMLENAEVVERFLRATQAGMQLTLESPDLAFEASRAYIDNLSLDRLEVLLVSSDLFTSSLTTTFGLGYSDPQGWEETIELLTVTGRISTDLPATAFFSNDFLPDLPEE
jgi:NitT/TauT family transport system substrate-binding protein